VQTEKQQKEVQCVMLLSEHEKVDPEVGLVHLEQGHQEDQVSMSLDWCST
jgi:hypothetical protein